MPGQATKLLAHQHLSGMTAHMRLASLHVPAHDLRASERQYDQRKCMLEAAIHMQQLTSQGWGLKPGMLCTKDSCPHY